MWWVLEPYHAVVYFAPEVSSAWRSARLAGFWMGYIASRAAPLGPAPAALAEATFYNFHPSRIRRAIPDAWELSTPETVLLASLGHENLDVILVRGPDLLFADFADVPGALRTLAGP